MTKAVKKQISNKLACYLSGEISLSEFSSWFGPILWDIEETSDESTQRTAYDIELSLSEFDSGDWTEDELRDKLLPFVTSLCKSLDSV